MKYKSVHRIPCDFAAYTARGIVAVVREELEGDDEGWEIINVETVQDPWSQGAYSFNIWIGELK